jgi:hypothetical protein
MAASPTDVWGAAALRQPGGPSYEFFRDLLPPLRYANTAFRHYPIYLCAPKAPVKARYVSNGSAVNARANKKPMWKEIGVPVSFHVGEKGEPYGEDLERLDGPRYLNGYLPIVRTAYRQGDTRFEQEAFGATFQPWRDQGTVFVRFTARQAPGTVAARIATDASLTATEGAVRDGQGQALVLFDAGWRWDGNRKELRAALNPGRPAVLAVLTQPLPPPFPALTPAVYDGERRACVETWEAVLARGSRFDIPEPVANDAWKSTVIGNFLIAVGDRMNYSAGNAYDHLYEGECGDATRALMLFGRTADARGMVGPLLDFNRQATRFHVAGHKLQLLAHYYWVTRDAEYLRAKEPVWGPVVEFIITSRKTANGLLPPDNYAGDIQTQVYSLNSNANCWRGLRDMAAVLADMGQPDRADRLVREAKDFRTAILDAVAKSEHREAKFIPVSLLGDEKPYDFLPATRFGSYYDLMIPYVLGSDLFAGTEREAWILDYLRTHGGIAMGMIRTTPVQGEFAREPGVNVLYGLRYMLTQLRRDERDLALVGFYGQLAQGMTQDTFIGGEGSRFLHGDRFGRSFYLPPNSASNAMFLTTLRYLLIQDWEDDAGRPATLRLLYGAPGRWLEDGKVLRVNLAPTMFGEVSFRVESHLGQGEVVLIVYPPKWGPETMSVRLPLPPGWRVIEARNGDAALTLAKDGAVELPGRGGKMTVRFRVSK